MRAASKTDTMREATMTYKLYYADGTASMGVRVLLEEIGARYELIPTTTDRKNPVQPNK